MEKYCPYKEPYLCSAWKICRVPAISVWPMTCIYPCMFVHTDEVHDIEFTGTLPKGSRAATPEPVSLMLMGTGMLGLAAALRRRLS